jgi:hypothetical protein
VAFAAVNAESQPVTIGKKGGGLLGAGVGAGVPGAAGGSGLGAAAAAASTKFCVDMAPIVSKYEMF